MPSKQQSVRVPKLCKDGNYACVYADGRKIRLGRLGTPEADLAYRQFVAKWLVSPVVATVQTHPTLDELALAFLLHKKEIGDSHYSSYKTAVRIMLSFYSGEQVETFDSSKVLVIQSAFVKKGFARTYCNTLVNYIREMLKWGVPYKLVPLPIYAESKLVPTLQAGKTKAPEREPRHAVPDDVLDRTMPHLLPTIAAMVLIQRTTGMRPGEICSMTVGEIGRYEDVWLYIPQKHKNAWRGKGYERIIPLRDELYNLIVPRLEGKGPNDPVFCPKNTVQERIERDKARRQSKVIPSQARQHEKALKNPKRKDGTFYKPASYYQAIQRAIESANKRLSESEQIPSWFPYQLRHSFAAATLRHKDSDLARALLGQKSLSTTMRYLHGVDAEMAIEHIRRQNAVAEK